MNYIVPYLKTQMERARPVLFTGAGFSIGSKNLKGQNMPMAGELKQALWTLGFPDLPFDSASDLQSVFEATLMRNATGVRDLLLNSLSVDGKSIPEWVTRYFTMPWFKYYTLNVDDLATRVQATHWIPRKLGVVSALNGHPGAAESTAETLGVVHLNGIIGDGPKAVTFSLTQYAQRIARQDPFYTILAAEMMTHPFVFVGTKLDESPLWQHLELRRQRGAGGELRPKSFLVTPTLDKPREVTLSQFNIEWISMTAEEFSQQVLAQLEPTQTKGLSAVSKKQRKIFNDADEIADLAGILNESLKQNDKTDYLLGREPTWADIRSGRAIERDVDRSLWQKAIELKKSKGSKGVMLISGTAGSGKSSSLMRLAMKLSFDGCKVGWIDRGHEMSVWAVQRAFRLGAKLDVLAIDDADNLGVELATTIREICADKPFPLVLLAMRSGKIDRVLNPVQLGNTTLIEEVMPPLTNSDISGLINSLTEDNKLGKLKGMPPSEQERVFREKAGRELIVAMIEATSGERFEDKAINEFEDLEPLKRKIYAVVSTATAQEFPLDKQGLLLSLGAENNNDTLNALDQLVKRNILISYQDGSAYRSRHRVIGELIQKKLQNSGQLYEVLKGLLSVLAAKVHPAMPNHAKPKRLLSKMVNHKFLHHHLGPEHARNLYADLEDFLRDEAHYWLQRGVLEVETGNLRLAKNWLDQAKGINPSDDYVEVEFALWQFKTAIESPQASSSPSLVDEAVKSLDHQITVNGSKFAHAFHVLGTQTLGWVRRSFQDYEDKKSMLLHALEMVSQGVKLHPHNEQLARVHKELSDERFSLVMR